MKKKSENKKIKLLILIFILLVVLFVLIGLISYLENYDPAVEAQKDYGYESQPVAKEEEYVEPKTLRIANSEVLQNLKGGLPVTTVTSKVKYVFTEAIPAVMKDIKGLKEAELKKYYADNKVNIKVNLKIDSEENFLNFAKKCSKITCDFAKDYKSCEFTNNDGLGLIFSYENGETIECKLVGENVNTLMYEF